MKRLFPMFLSVCIFLTGTITPFAAASSTQENNTDDMLEVIVKQNTLVQEIERQYGPLVPVSNSVRYYVTEYYEAVPSDTVALSLVEANERQTETVVYEFHEYPAEYIENLKNRVSTADISPGGSRSIDFTVLRVYLAFWRIEDETTSNKKYFVCSSFDWLELPDAPFHLNYIRGACGLALAPQLSMDGSSYSGNLTYRGYNNNGEFHRVEALPISATSVDAIGGNFSLEHCYVDSAYNIITELSGMVGCIATQTNNSDVACSGMACYNDVSFGLMNGFSVSYPLGISFDFGTISEPYNVQDTLLLE